MDEFITADDFTILCNIEEHGPSYFDMLIKESSEPLKIKICNYISIYFSEQNNYDDYLDYIGTNSDSKIWSFYCDNYNNSNDFTSPHECMSNIIHCFRKKQYTIDDFIKLLSHVIIANYEYINATDMIMNHDDLMYLQHQILEELLSSLKPDQTNYHKNIKNIATIISLSTYYMHYFFDMFDDDISAQINYDDMNGTHHTLANVSLMNMCYIMLYLYELKNNDDVIDCTFISSPNCAIRWYDKRKEDDSTIEYNNKTEAFFFVLYAMKLIYTPLIMKYREYKKNLEINNGMIVPVRIEEIKKYWESFIKYAEMFLNDGNLEEMINKFYVEFMKWYTDCDNKFVIDDTLYDIHMFYDIKKILKYDIDGTIMKFFLDVVMKFTRNVSIRNEYFMVFFKFFKNMDNVYNFGNILKQLMSNITDVFLDIKDYKLSERVIFASLNNFYSLILTTKKWDMLMQNDSLGIKKMLNTTLMNMFSMIDVCKDYEYIIMNNDIPSHYCVKYVNDIMAISELVNNSMNFISHFLESNIEDDNMNKKKQTIIYSNEIFTTIINLIETAIDFNKNHFEFYTTIKNISSTVNADFVNYDILSDIVMSLLAVNMIDTIKINNCIVNIKQLDKIVNSYVPLKKRKMDNDEKEKHDKLQKLYEIYKGNYNENMNITIPDEFTDPLTCELIHEPSLLPDMADNVLFFDKSSIIRQLLIKEENPYDRKKLTIDEFREYNDRDDIKRQILDFQIKLNKWKHENNMT